MYFLFGDFYTFHEGKCYFAIASITGHVTRKQGRTLIKRRPVGLYAATAGRSRSTFAQYEQRDSLKRTAK